MRDIFLEHGIDLYADAVDAPGANGVRRIHAHLARHGQQYRDHAPLPGDLVFFDDTWDLDGDGRADDPLTHVGLVERIEADGTVVFISRVARAVERYHMNLGAPHLHRGPDGRILNDHLRRKRTADDAGIRYLTGELFAGYGARIVD
jgi:hypothetical protein